MGTLTGNALELAEHCPHKLPTSCRLTATTACCACQDRRPHSDAYPTYIDGVGLVQRGKRWQRYCWFCKEFWENRVAAVQPPIEPKHTRVPEEPNQDAFVSKWHEYHRGYRLEKQDDGEERRVEVKPEVPWIEVAPGYLPVEDRKEREVPTQRIVRPENEEREEQIDLDSTLDDLLQDADNESQPNANQQARERRRIPMQVPTARDNEMVMQQLREAGDRVQEAVARRRQLQQELRDAEVEVRTRTEDQARLSRESRAAMHFARVFGTREEIERAGADYVSPLTSMFTRAYDRYQVAEEVRANERLWQDRTQQERDWILANMRAPELEALQAMRQDRARRTQARDDALNEQTRTLDDDDEARPAPLSTEAMTIRLDCKVCLQQKADTAVLPCGHLILCSYCASIVVPNKKDDPMTPLRRDNPCPFCQKPVKRMARIFTAH